MNILIVDAGRADPAMLQACVTRIQRFYDADSEAEPVITVNEPERDGFLQYLIKLPYTGTDRAMFIGAVRRAGSTEIEFHS